jgi:hypothetical protein
MATEEWEHKDLWNKRGGNFLVQVSRHLKSLGSANEGVNRWCVYAYIYPEHPHYTAFKDAGFYQEAAEILPLHGGCTYLEYIQYDGELTSIKVGCDYHHLGDEVFTYYDDRASADKVFRDADELFAWLLQHDNS